MSGAARLSAAAVLALVLHGLALAAAAAWVPVSPALPPVVTGLVVDDAGPGEPATVRVTARAVGTRASAGAEIIGELQPPGGGAAVPFRVTIPPGPPTETSTEVALPPDAAGPWKAEASPGKAAPLTTSFWVDDGRPPDLAVDALDAGGTTATAGGAVRVAWRRVNRGTGWLRGGGRDEASLLAAGTKLVAATARGFPPLPPGGSSLHTLTLPVPPEAGGVLVLRVGVDSGRELAEPHGPENTAELPLLVEPSPYPDLAATRLDLGPAATLAEAPPVPADPPTLVAGRSLPARLAVENLRPAPAAGVRRDAFYLSTDDRLDPGDTELLSVDRNRPLPGRGVDATSGELVVPAGFVSPGDDPRRAFVLGVVDAGEAVNEGDPANRRNNVIARDVSIVAEEADPPETPLGRDDAEPRVTVAWISHDAFEELQARRRRTLQPSQQAAATPVPDAPARDATAPPTPPSRPSPAPATPATPADPAAAAPPPAAGDPVAPGEELPAPGPGDTPAPEPNPRTAAESSSEAPRSADPSDTPPAPASPPPAPEGPREPTSAPRDDASSDATAEVDATTLQPGRVDVGPGLTVDVARPKIDAVAILSSIVRSPRVAVTFDRDGSVLNAQILRSAGSNAVDAPILRSLYRWRASGDRLETWDGPRTFEFTFLFSR